MLAIVDGSYGKNMRTSYATLFILISLSPNTQAMDNNLLFGDMMKHAAEVLFSTIVDDLPDGVIDDAALAGRVDRDPAARNNVALTGIIASRKFPIRNDEACFAIVTDELEEKLRNTLSNIVRQESSQTIRLGDHYVLDRFVLKVRGRGITTHGYVIQSPDPLYYKEYTPLEQLPFTSAKTALTIARRNNLSLEKTSQTSYAAILRLVIRDFFSDVLLVKALILVRSHKNGHHHTVLEHELEFVLNPVLRAKL